MIWAVVRSRLPTKDKDGSQSQPTSFAQGSEDCVEATLVGVLLLSEVLQAINSMSSEMQTRTVTSQRLGSITSLCCIDVPDSESSPCPSVCSVIIGTSSGYVLRLDLQTEWAGPTAPSSAEAHAGVRRSLFPCTCEVTAATSDSSEGRSMPVVKQSLTMRLVWCRRVCQRSVEHVLYHDGNTNTSNPVPAFLAVQYGPHFSLVTVHGEAAGRTREGSIAGDSSWSHLSHGDIISALQLTRKPDPATTRYDPIVLTAGISGTILSWSLPGDSTQTNTSSSSPSHGHSPTSAVLSNSKVVSGLCVDSLELMYAHVSHVPSSAAGKRFGNPKMHKLTLKPLPGLEWDMTNIVHKLKVTLAHVSNSIVRTRHSHFDLSGLVMYVLYELSRWGNSLENGGAPAQDVTDRKPSRGDCGDTIRVLDDSTETAQVSASDNAVLVESGEESGRKERKRRRLTSLQAEVVDEIDVAGWNNGATGKKLVLADEALLRTYEHMLSACDADNVEDEGHPSSSTTPRREASHSSTDPTSIARMVDLLIMSLYKAALLVGWTSEETPLLEQNTSSGGIISALTGIPSSKFSFALTCLPNKLVFIFLSLISLVADPAMTAQRLALWRCLHACLCGVHRRHSAVLRLRQDFLVVPEALKGCIRLVWADQLLERCVCHVQPASLQ